LLKQIEIIQPKIIVTLGNFATKFALAGFDPKKMKEVDGITKVRGKFKQIKFDGDVFLVMPTYHPAAILYNRSLQKQIESDFIELKKLAR
jgi:DNA polymerase